MRALAYISLLLMLPITTWSMEKQSPMAVVPLGLMSDQPVSPTTINGQGNRPTPIHAFTTWMVDYSALDQNWNEEFIVTNLKNKIWLEINPYDDSPLDFDCEIEVTINFWHFSFPTGNETNEEHTFKVNYKKDAHSEFKSIDLLELTGGQKVNVVISSINVNGLTPAQQVQVNNKVYLKAQTLDTRHYKLSAFEQIQCNSLTQTTVNQNIAKIAWAPLDCAEEYDIEIKFDDFYNSEASPTSGYHKPFGYVGPYSQKDFYNNATRLTTKNNFIEIPMLNEQVIYRLRIRPVGRQGEDFVLRYEHEWSCDNNIVIVSDPHEDDKLNYQSITTYAEEGKYKVVNEYFDGRMSSRQKVTALQSKVSNNYFALVQESIYDGAGRKAIEVLPGPVKDGDLQFYPGFNQSQATGQAYHFTDFEGKCMPTPEKMGTNQGTSHYYSPSFYNGLNAQEQDGELKLIPDANGYPFSQTRFMNDNTSRPLAQGGVGKDHIIGSGHETNISYVQPTQEELDRLFGTEVGYARNYKKVVTQDPNGQVSYAYQDLKGNTIATSLSGGTENLDDLITNKAIDFNSDLTSFTKEDTLQQQLYTEHNFFVGENGTEYIFNYGVATAAFTDQTCSMSSICYDCIYKVQVTLTNTDCNTIEFTETKMVGDIDQINQICEGYNWTSSLANETLDKGNYAIKVELTVDEYAAEKYVENYFNDPTNQCVQHLSDFEEAYLAQIPDTPCGFDCAYYQEEIQALEAKLSKAEAILQGPQTPASLEKTTTIILQLEAQIDLWNEVCESDKNACEIARMRMLQDLSPFGQYGTVEINANGEMVGGDVLSLFSDGNLLDIDITSGQFTFPFTQMDGTVENLDPDDFTLEEFVTNFWQQEWSEQFLPFHPEYCYLLMCHEESAEFDITLHAIESAAQAIQEGLIVANGSGTAGPDNLALILDADPNFGASGNLNGEKLELQAEIDNYFHFYPSMMNMPNASLYELAIEQTCGALQGLYDTGEYPNPPPTNCLSINFGYADTEIADMLWNNYKSLYLSLKNKYEYLWRTGEAIQQGCYNECIGQDPFFQIRNGFLGSSFDQDFCNNAHAEYYADKDKVFPGPYDQPGMEDIEDIYDYEALYENVNTIGEAVTDSINESGCVIEGSLPVFPLNGINLTGNGQCIEYTCLDELAGFFNQFIPSNGTANENDFTDDQSVDIPSCFGGSPFLNYNWFDAERIGDKHTYIGTIGSVASDPNLCQVEFTFFKLDGTPLNATNDEYYFAAISSFTSFELDLDYLDIYGETSHFIGRAMSSYGGGQTPVGVKGNISCAKLGRCCTDQSDEGIAACLNVPNVDNPATVEEELWIGGSNPYFDPNWIKDPCQETEEPDVETPEIVCDTLLADFPPICCPPDTIIYGGIIENDCEQERIDLALFNASVAYEQYLEDAKKDIKASYLKKCLDAVQNFTMEYSSSEHHFVLSYYDQSGNLTRTVPPNGTYDYEADVDKTFSTQAQLDAVAQARTNNQVLTPDYLQWDTRYTYNSLNQITTQNLPDHGTANLLPSPNPRDGVTKFHYDALGRLAFSQNPKQELDDQYSYTTYDNLGRIIESGQARSPHQNNVFLQGLVFNPYGGGEHYPRIFLDMCDKEQITHTYYDEAAPQAFEYSMPNHKMTNLRNRVAYAEYYDTQAQLNAGNGGISGSYYSYDVLGNVRSLGQRLSGAFFKTIEYEYDLVSGNVNKVIYQRDEEDQFLHRYEYDADNRITQVETSIDNCIWEKEAKYFYYPHGPLARVELGAEEVQGQDYIYTIHGWIKGVNSVALTNEHDPGSDGDATAQNSSFAPDEVGYMLNYYQDDYQSISGIQSFSPDVYDTSEDLFNGNIRNMTTSIGHFIRENNDYGYVSNDYSYDQLNRITEMRPWDGFNANTNLWDSNDPRGNLWDNKPYHTDYSYDGNGNILTLNRNGAPSQIRMDELTYDYRRKNNQLANVKDDVPRNNYPLDPADPFAIHDIDSRTVANYEYDKIGNLTRDKAEGLRIDWNVQGKVRHITDTNGLPNTPGGTISNPTSNPNDDRHIDMIYDPLGNRIAKVVDGLATYYVRDAQGNVMSTYEQEDVPMRYLPEDTGSVGNGPVSTTTSTIGRLVNPGLNSQLPMWNTGDGEMKWTSAYLYGSDRIGEYSPDKTIGGPQKEVSEEIESVNLGDQLNQTSNPTTPSIDLSNIDIQIIGSFLPNSNFGNLTNLFGNHKPAQTAFNFKKGRTAFSRDYRQYELNNHLGNVLTTVSDRKSVQLSPSGGGSGGGISVLSEVQTANDYYPGGMLTPDRNYRYINLGVNPAQAEGLQRDNYRYKHQSQESDDEIAGNGSTYFYKYRMSDSRLNRFWSVDPLCPQYPHYSVYQFSGNKLIHAFELEGLEESEVNENSFEQDLTDKAVELEKDAWVYQISAEVMTDLSNGKVKPKELTKEYVIDNYDIPDKIFVMGEDYDMSVEGVASIARFNALNMSDANDDNTVKQSKIYFINSKTLILGMYAKTLKARAASEVLISYIELTTSKSSFFGGGGSFGGGGGGSYDENWSPIIKEFPSNVEDLKKLYPFTIGGK